MANPHDAIQLVRQNPELAIGTVLGFEIALKLVLGEQVGENDPEFGHAYDGDVPDELRGWVNAALARIELVKPILSEFLPDTPGG